MFNIKEDSRNEFKSNLDKTLEKEIVGFLSGNGGNIYIGVDDNGKVIGVNDDLDKIQLKIKDRIKNNILPSTSGLFDVTIEEFDEKNVIHITVANGNQKPYYIRELGMTSKGCYIRNGNSLDHLTENQIEELYSKRTRNSLTKIISPRQDLKFSQLKIYYEEKGFTINNNFLKSLDFITEEGKYNYLAFLLSDENNVSMKVATYSGSDSYDLIENEEFGYCSIIKSTKSVLEKFEINNRTFTKITGKERKELKMVNKVAMREAIINAIVHNLWEREVPPRFEIFSDHIAITSSGGIPRNYTEEEFLLGYSSPVNPELMRIFKDLDMVEQLGTGISRILKHYDKNVYTFTPNFIKIEFKYNENTLSMKYNDKKEAINELNNTQLEILNLINNKNNITQETISNILKINRVTVAKNLKKLKDNEYIERIGSNKKGYWKILK